MSDKDVAIKAVGNITSSLPDAVYVSSFQVNNTISKKPCYLIILDVNPKNKAKQHFIAIDKPDLLSGFIQTKGFYSESSEEEIVQSFHDLMKNVAKEEIIEMMFPCHRVYGIRSLVFNALKPSTLTK